MLSLSKQRLIKMTKKLKENQNLAKEPVKESKDPIQDLESQLNEYKDHLQRLQADFENFIKRTNAEKEKFTEYIESKVLSKFLTIADDFEKTIGSENKEIIQLQLAVEMIFKNFMKVLELHGIKSFESLNKECDPCKHEIIETVEGKQDGIVIEELRKGYLHRDKVLRPAVVKTSRRKENAI